MRISPALLSLLPLLGCAAETSSPGSTGGFALGSAPPAICEVTLRETGRTVSVEEEYLAGVVACENGAASDEALRAQAVAARSWLYVHLQRTSTVCNSEDCQVFSCGRSPDARHRAAVRDTAGEVLVHEGHLVQAFYVAGVRRSGASCDVVEPTSAAGVRTEPYTTPGQAGRTGDAVQIAPPPLSSGLRTPENRGCMSQNGADCLAREAGYGYRDILRYYYGGDVEIVRAEGTCVPGSVPDGACVHSTVGGIYPDGGCTRSYQCVAGAWAPRSGGATCVCEEGSGAGCEAPDPDTCVHSFGGSFADGGCTASYRCDAGRWTARAPGDVCSCVETTGTIGCEGAGASCTHSRGGRFVDSGCTGGWRCDDGGWVARVAGDDAHCACLEPSGELGCGLAPAGATCAHTYGGTYRHLGCTAGYQCDDGVWRRRGSGAVCVCEEVTGRSGC